MWHIYNLKQECGWFEIQCNNKRLTAHWCSALPSQVQSCACIALDSVVLDQPFRNKQRHRCNTFMSWFCQFSAPVVPVGCLHVCWKVRFQCGIMSCRPRIMTSQSNTAGSRCAPEWKVRRTHYTGAHYG